MDFVNHREEFSFNHKHPQIDEGYSFGRSDQANNARLDQIKDQQLIAWIEFSDDTVGAQQIAGGLPLYDLQSAPFP